MYLFDNERQLIAPDKTVYIMYFCNGESFRPNAKRLGLAIKKAIRQGLETNEFDFKTVHIKALANIDLVGWQLTFGFLLKEGDIMKAVAELYLSQLLESSNLNRVSDSILQSIKRTIHIDDDLPQTRSQPFLFQLKVLQTEDTESDLPQIRTPKAVEDSYLLTMRFLEDSILRGLALPPHEILNIAGNRVHPRPNNEEFSFPRRERSGMNLGDSSCSYCARSPHLRCAVNPTGPCEGCEHYKPQ